MISITERPRVAAAPWTPAKAVLVGGLIAGACDMAYALLWFAGVKHAPWMKIPQSVAGGLLGKASFDGGASTVVLGFALHWSIALIWAAIYVYAARRFLPDLLRKPIPYGFAYGAWIYFFMNWVVLPLDAMHTKPHFAPLDTWLTGLAVHVFGIGLAISLSAAKTAPLA
ncbi:MAG TPA: hypothetical protein VLI43_00160 [Gemmatimonadaceae bacterium]|nr:hypothetical protein [Gemmatimonadaceae bacterium]